jgi:uncharacterized protein
MSLTRGYKPSRYNILVWETGRPYTGDLLVYNSFSSAFIRLCDPSAAAMARLVDGSDDVRFDAETLETLVDQGVLVDGDIDELGVVDKLDQKFKSDDSLNLIIMPTEKCNFRCVYCYETFEKGRMSEDVIEGITSLVRRRSPTISRLHVDWFGGEPLVALGVVKELSDRLIAVCKDSGINYVSAMTTNGYLLSSKAAQDCITREIRRFQITLDGTAETHNKLRILANGNDTFDTIISNLQDLRERTDSFHVRLRVNFTPDVVREIPRFLAFVGDLFGGDTRFSIHFHPVGRWGGPHDDQLETCDNRSSDQLNLEFLRVASENGISTESWNQALRLYGNLCYAADPKSLVIGSDGSVYKCTVAFQDPRNMVGMIDKSGHLQLDQDKMDLWTKSGAESDPECRRCAFRPACHGNSCPLERMENNGAHTCPPAKRQIRELLPLLVTRPGAPSLG